jgi:hypothetical protein
MGGGSRVCGAGPDTEGGDARRPCHGHAAGIRRLQRGLGFGSAAAEARGKKERARAGGCAGCRGAERRAGWRLTQGCGAAAGEREKGGRRFRYPVAGRGRAASRGGASRGRERGRRKKGKLTGGARPSAAPGEGK